MDLETQTSVRGFDPTEEQWQTDTSFDTESRSHEEIVDCATKIYNQWLAKSLSDRIT